MSEDENNLKHYIKLFGNIFISFMGAGILGLPYAFSQAGIFLGSLTIIVVCFTSVIGMLTLLSIKQTITHSNSLEKTSDDQKAHEEIEFREVGHYAYGPVGLLMVELAIVFSQIGFCCAYLIFILEAISEFFPQFPEHYFLVVIFIPMFFLVSLSKLNSLGLFSMFANFITLFAYSIILYSEVEHISVNKDDKSMVNLSSFPFFFSVSIYCYEGAGLIFSLESSPHKSIRHHFRTIFITSMAIITSVYIIFGICGYLAYGVSTMDIITRNIEGSFLQSKLKIFLSVSLFFTYPVMMFPVSLILDRRLRITEKFGAVNIIIRILLVLLTGCIIILIPQFSTIMELVGATLCTSLNFIFPGLFYLAIIGKKNGILYVTLAIALISFGVVGMIIGTIDVVVKNFL